MLLTVQPGKIHPHACMRQAVFNVFLMKGAGYFFCILQKSIPVILNGNRQQFGSQRDFYINPDCGLKTRDVPETKASLINMVAAAKQVRKELTHENQPVL